MRERGITRRQLASELALPLTTIDEWLQSRTLSRAMWLACLHVCALPREWREWHDFAGDDVFPPDS
jgi:hypothetical protein